MTEIAIHVENLSKRYRLGSALGSGTFQELIMATVKEPVHRIRNWWHCRSNPGRTEIAKSRTDYIWALRQIHLDVHQGDVVGIIGRNGAGKSTLLKILSRITSPTQGRVELRGRVGSLLEVGTGFHPELSGRENIFLYGAILGMRRFEIQRKFDEIVAFADLERFLDTPVKRYSSGMYMRLAFAVAAHLESEILLVDEVLAVGDVAFRNKCLEKMGDVSRQGRTVLFVSHNMAAIRNLCTSGVLLDQGRIVFQGTAQDTVRMYLNQAVSRQSQVLLPSDRPDIDPDFRFIAVRIFDIRNQPTSEVMLSEGFQIEIEYEIKAAIKGANISFSLWNSTGECVFTSTDVDEDPESITQNRPPGCYRTRCHVPAQYLRHGVYIIDIGASIPKYRLLDKATGVISLEVVDDGSVESRLSQGRQGVINPCLKWETEKQKSI